VPSFPLGPGNKFLLKDGRGVRACCRLTETLDIVTPPGVIAARTKRYERAVPTEDILGHAFYFVLLLEAQPHCNHQQFSVFSGPLIRCLFQQNTGPLAGADQVSDSAPSGLIAQGAGFLALTMHVTNSVLSVSFRG
jgi:hypothetical protein